MPLAINFLAFQFLVLIKAGTTEQYENDGSGSARTQQHSLKREARTHPSSAKRRKFPR